MRGDCLTAYKYNLFFSCSALALRAQALSQQGKPNAAIRDADRALELNADSVLALRWRGKARAQKGDW